jgi:uncharacterized phiE125 gp8 family phage protein
MQRNVNWRLTRTVAPAIEPVSVPEARAHCSYDDTDQDDLIASLITTAREMVETDTQRALITQTWTLKLDGFPCDYIEGRLCPLGSVTGIAYTDSAGDAQTLATSVYLVSNSEPWRITLKYGQSWPTTLAQADVVTVTFTAGYGGAADVPERAKQAIKLLVGHWFQNREAVIVGTITKDIELAYDSLIQRLMWSGYR